MRWSDAATADWLERVGHRGDVRPTLESLAALQHAHATAIPFEHFDALLGRPPALDLPSLQHKFVAARRGGWCFEHAAFLQAQLGAVGIDTTVLPAAVLWEQPVASRPRAEHAVLLATLDGARWLVDAGFGRLTLTAPLRLEPGLEQATPHGLYRLVAEPDGLLRLEARLERGWAPLYRLAQRPWPAADWAAVNAALALGADSRFRGNLFLARAGTDGSRHSLRNGLYLRRDASGAVAEARPLADLETLRAVMDEAFGLSFDRLEARDSLAREIRPLLRTPP